MRLSRPAATRRARVRPHALRPALERLEDQMTNWDPLGEARSPDRLDACVWALSELMIEAGPSGLIDFYAREVSRLKD